MLTWSDTKLDNGGSKILLGHTQRKCGIAKQLYEQV